MVGKLTVQPMGCSFDARRRKVPGMRVIVLGGTRFIGRAIVEALVVAGHEPLICHRGDTEPDDLPATIAHLHADRNQLLAHRARLEAFGAEAVVDCLAMSAADARTTLAALPDPAMHRVVLSSQDVYRAFATLQHDGLATDTVPIDEDAPRRADRYPYPNLAAYSKLDVEEIVLDAGATVLRLPMTYGPHDYQRREEWVLRRVRARRRQIPVGVASALLPLGFVGDVARGVVSALERRSDGAGVYNLVAADTDPIAVWMRRILLAAGSDLEVVRVPDGTALPDDLQITTAMSQPLVISSARARRDLGYRDTDPDEAVARSVEWHLAHPPGHPDEDFTGDDEALAVAGA
jgi:nucleoside-diphosphate-sugar epimerase